MDSPAVPVCAEVARVSPVSTTRLLLASLMSWRSAFCDRPARVAENVAAAERVNFRMSDRLVEVRESLNALRPISVPTLVAPERLTARRRRGSSDSNNSSIAGIRILIAGRCNLFLRRRRCGDADHVVSAGGEMQADHGRIIPTEDGYDRAAEPF